MISLSKAQSTVMSLVEPGAEIELDTASSLGHYLSRGLVAQIDVPPFDNSAMDGYALRSEDLSQVPRDFDVVGLRLAGRLSGRDQRLSINSGQAVRIMTGAPIPVGADCVCMVEQAMTSQDANRVTILKSLRPGENVRKQGDDLARGTTLAGPGDRLSPGLVALLVSAGCPRVTVFSHPRVGVLSTGSELVELPPGSSGQVQLGAGEIFDSNRPMIMGLLGELGLSPDDIGHVRDDLDEVIGRINQLRETYDVVVMSGGVSVGDADMVKAAISKLCGNSGYSMQVAIRPAKPLAFGSIQDDDGKTTLLFGLPGNPVSAAVSFELFVRPAILKSCGARQPFRNSLRARFAEALASPKDGKDHFIRVQLSHLDDGSWVARPSDKQGSHQLSGLGFCDGLAICPGDSNEEVINEADILVTNPRVLG